jgi:hypothetical protein
MRSTLRAHSAHVALVGVLVTACSSGNIPCNSVGPALESYPLITVIDTKTGRPICDAMIVVTAVAPYLDPDGGPVEGVATKDAAPYLDAGYTMMLPPASPETSPCSYEAIDLPGIVTLAVSLAGYETEEVSNVYPTVTTGCQLPPAEVVSVKLTPVTP